MLWISKLNILHCTFKYYIWLKVVMIKITSMWVISVFSLFTDYLLEIIQIFRGIEIVLQLIIHLFHTMANYNASGSSQ